MTEKKEEEKEQKKEDQEKNSDKKDYLSKAKRVSIFDKYSSLASLIKPIDLTSIYSHSIPTSKMGLGHFLESYITKSAPELTSSRLSLNKEINILASDLLKTSPEKDEEVFKKKYEELLKKVKLEYLASRVNQEAEKKLYRSKAFVNKFESAEMCNTVVISIDIRRSTDLMLKAKNPGLFSAFITTLSHKIIDIIKDNYGVIDKFTGDGILAFFPEFFSGPDAYYFALKTANECHECFAIFYKESRKCFTTVLKDVGLGIGIDSGKVHLQVINVNLTIVGTPVVYACRLSGAGPGITLINQTALEEIEKLYDKHISIKESEIDIKHEGLILAYIVDINFKAIEPKIPDWNEFPDDKPEKEK